jgi:hypothetical protein
MVSITNGEWIADLGSMTCRNIENRIVVTFEINDRGLQGKIQNMPIDLMSGWAAEPHGERRMREVVEEAEEVFLRAYYESRMEYRAPAGTKEKKR